LLSIGISSLVHNSVTQRPGQALISVMFGPLSSIMTIERPSG